VLIIPALLVIASCHDYKADVDRLTKEKTAMEESVKYKDSTIVAFINEVNDIEDNLAAIETMQKQSGMAISSSSGSTEMNVTQSERIKENIRAINELMKENKARIASLNQKLKASNMKVSEFESMIARLNTQAEERDKQLVALNEQVNSLNTTVQKLNTDVSMLTVENSEKARVIEGQTTKLHTAYYTTGTAKELVDKKVLVKEGGFLGLGRTEKLVGNADVSAFNRIDITQTSSIPIEAKDAKIVTTHPSDSYILQHTGTNQLSSLVITDPDRFWKTSKYLVVVVDK
jgi:predicted RNase H-like nuclease (RuvC/YqgF family)